MTEMRDAGPNADLARPEVREHWQSTDTGGRLGRHRSRFGAPTPDHQRFLDLAMPHLDTLHNVAYGLTRDPHRAEDLVQETYLRAFGSFSQYRGGSLRAWLVSICLNAGRSDLRRDHRRPQEDLGLDILDRLETTSDPAIDVVQRLSLMAALGRLPDEQRVSIVLCDLGGFTAQEVADLLSCPRGTILARVHRGRRRLAQLIDRESVRDGA